MKIGFFSDLHLEGSNLKLPLDASYDAIVLAGDISSDLSLLDDFFKRQIPAGVPTVFVPGNHEFESYEFTQSLQVMQEICDKHKNIHFLYNKSVVINSVQFIGTTLWSNFEGQGESARDSVMRLIPSRVDDFRKILKKEGEQYVPWAPEDMAAEFQRCYEYLRQELSRPPPYVRQRIVVTHFAPHPVAISQEFKCDILSAYWVNNLVELLGLSDFWLMGHVHNSVQADVAGTELLSNPRGFSKLFNVHQNKEFKPSMALHIALGRKSSAWRLTS